MFTPASGQADFPQQEQAILAWWNEHGIFEKSLAKTTGGTPFVFYEGPPTANGMPHPGHCLTRAIKDLFPRYKTMQGFHCRRKAGWDTHGLPVEVEVCKELGIHSKEEIEAFGVEPFIQKCQQSVWRYMQEWRNLTERLGFWVNLDEAYVTYHQSYVESVWWSLKNLFDRGLLYRGHKIVWWWAQGGTALSAGEVGQGYRQVADPSVYVKFPLVIEDENDPLHGASLLVWTTTPWTLPSNQFAAVHPDIEYALVEAHHGDTESTEKLLLAKDLVETIAEKTKTELKVLETMKGADLIGLQYLPPFDCYWKHSAAKHSQWSVTAADFVTTESGSGIVHQAPAFGEVDFDVLLAQRAKLKEELPLLNAVGPDGKFTDEAPEFLRGRWVKDCDKDITRDLKQRGLLFHQEQYLHDYPFCWRAPQDPLIQYPRESWFVRTTQFKDEMLANNAEINWLPGHIKEGRFGKFLESNVDWALSRERFWGTPLPIWVCEQTGEMEAIGSYEELLAKPGIHGTQAWDDAKANNPDLAEDLKVHKPYIDEVTYASPFAEGSRMRRVSEVIDCWYDSGAMPFAQWGYRGDALTQGDPPHPSPLPEREGARLFHEQFPADFISEALDQTRGWFYSQLAISTLLFGKGNEAANPQSKIQNPQWDYPHPFKNCIVLGLMLGEDGQKMSKSLRNYREPNEIFDKYGADALRWYFFAKQPPWTSIRYSEPAIKESIPEFLLRLWNCFSFFTIYANTDQFDPASQLAGEVGELSPEVLHQATKCRAVDERPEIDRWILSDLQQTIADVTAAMDAFDNFTACGRLIEFVDALSNWYVRRNRARFWESDKASQSKLDAYWTLYECLLTTTKLVAPFVPFVAETLWQTLAAEPFGERAMESVHLCRYPIANAAQVDAKLSQRMQTMRTISSLGRQARGQASLKVRQPLAKVEVVLADSSQQAWLEENCQVLQDELNVKAVEFAAEADEFVDYTVVPNFKLLGPKLGKNMPKVKAALASASGQALREEMTASGNITLEIDGQAVELTAEEIEVRMTAKEGWAAASDAGIVVVLATELTEALLDEGVAKDLVRAIQDLRKAKGCEFTDRIELAIDSSANEVTRAVDRFGEMIASETLTTELSQGTLSGVEPADATAGDHKLQLYLQVAS